MKSTKKLLKTVLLGSLLPILLTPAGIAQTADTMENRLLAEKIPEANAVIEYNSGNKGMIFDIYAKPPATSQVTLILDGKVINLKTQAFINNDGRTMISLADFCTLFGCQADFADSSQIWLQKDEVKVSFRLNEYYYLKNNIIFTIDTSPVKIRSDYFLPLRYTAESLGYTIKYNPVDKAVVISSSYNQSNDKTDNEEEAGKKTFSIPENLPCWGTLAATPELAALYHDYNVVGGYYTTLLSKLSNRTNNIILACKQLNGQIVNPGEVFSFNNIVGIRSSQKGYQEAPIFVDKEVVPGIGGGICQVSSTLYNAALNTGMQIVERYPHSLKVNYVPDNQDATVSWGGADFKFRNTKDYPIKIFAQVSGKYVITAIADARPMPKQTDNLTN